MNDDFDESDSELFAKYFVVGKILEGSVVVNIRVDSVDLTSLSATGTVVDENGDGFENGEEVFFKYLGDGSWRVTSDANKHGHPVILGEEFDGVGIGS